MGMLKVAVGLLPQGWPRADVGVRLL